MPTITAFVILSCSGTRLNGDYDQVITKKLRNQPRRQIEVFRSFLRLHDIFKRSSVGNMGRLPPRGVYLFMQLIFSSFWDGEVCIFAWFFWIHDER
uniref:Uncharacterized protein n=1 Tax=Rhizophora mucronata TaxID=61149 RepID=A0A2P2PCU0_RHIMU